MGLIEGSTDRGLADQQFDSVMATVRSNGSNGSAGSAGSALVSRSALAYMSRDGQTVGAGGRILSACAGSVAPRIQL